MISLLFSSNESFYSNIRVERKVSAFILSLGFIGTAAILLLSSKYHFSALYATVPGGISVFFIMNVICSLKKKHLPQKDIQPAEVVRVEEGEGSRCVESQVTHFKTSEESQLTQDRFIKSTYQFSTTKNYKVISWDASRTSGTQSDSDFKEIFQDFPFRGADILMLQGLENHSISLLEESLPGYKIVESDSSQSRLAIAWRDDKFEGLNCFERGITTGNYDGSSFTQCATILEDKEAGWSFGIGSISNFKMPQKKEEMQSILSLDQVFDAIENERERAYRVEDKLAFHLAGMHADKDHQSTTDLNYNGYLFDINFYATTGNHKDEHVCLKSGSRPTSLGVVDFSPSNFKKFATDHLPIVTLVVVE